MRRLHGGRVAQPVYPVFAGPSLGAEQLPAPMMLVDEGTGQTIVGDDDGEEAVNSVEALAWALVVES